MKKQLLRVKQIADQTFLRAEKTEVLTEDLINAEKRVDVIKQSCQITHKKIASCHIDFGSEISAEKRLKKIPQVALSSSMQENGNSFSKNSVLGSTLRECASTQAKLGSELLDYYTEVEKSVLKPIVNVLDYEMHSINKLRKQLGKLTLDMDSARTRFQTAERHSIQTSSTGQNSAMGKVDTLKDELEEASQKVEQCRDALATEMYSLISKEPQLSQVFVHMHQVLANYHRNALAILEVSLPILENNLSNFPQKPAYGCLLEEHLRVTNRQIAHVIETCVFFLLEYGILEEGLLRIAGSASKLKKLKSAFDAGYDIDMTEYVRDPHAVSGALKSYLRELPEPLMTFVLYDEWMNAAKIPDFDARLQSLWQVVHKLPEPNFHNLRYVIKFLSKLHDNVEVNKMSSQNIAIVMAPNLIWNHLEDPNANFGMNMSTANHHSTIVDMLISYADWFFPDSEFSFGCKMTSSVTSLGMSSCDSISPHTAVTVDDEMEENENTVFLTPGSNPSPSSHSPKTGHRISKKPAAPPPPAQRQLAFAKPAESIVPTAELIELAGKSSLVALVTDSDEPGPIKTSSPESAHVALRERIPIPRTSVVRRRSNENLANLTSVSTSKIEKPNIPDKPSMYSTYSLDRKLARASFVAKGSGHDKGVEFVSRQIERPSVPPPERPSVPPPERPSKPSRPTNVENVNTAETVKHVQKCDTNVDNVVSEVKSLAASEMQSLDEHDQDTDLGLPVYDLVRHQSSPTTLQSKSQSKQNRFDFLVANVVEKPPERPPRSTSAIQDLTERISSEIPNTSSRDYLEKQLSPTSSIKDELSEQAEATFVVPPSPSPRSPEVDRPKPPRPQPPIPFAKPKIYSTDNTNL